VTKNTPKGIKVLREVKCWNDRFFAQMCLLSVSLFWKFAKNFRVT